MEENTTNEMEIADRLRRAKQDETSSQETKINEPEEKSLRQRYLEARKAMDVKQRVKDKLKDKAKSLIGGDLNRQFTAQVLKNSWFLLIPSFGTSLLAIDFIVFLGAVFGKEMICPLGHEWVPLKLAQTNKEAAEKVGNSIGIIEKIFFGIFNVFALAIIFSGLGLLIMIFGWIDNPLKAISDLGWGTVKVLWDLFKNVF